MKTFIFFVLSIFSVPIALFSQSAIAMYLLNNTANDISGNNYNGSLNATSATTNRFGTINTATFFDFGLSSTGTLPLDLVTAVNDDFTLGFWFKTSMSASSSSQWYGGNALVDAEVCGVTADWGTALIDGGKVAMGIGNPDITIKSIANYNDDSWHFVTVTRSRSAGTIILYMDGVQEASSTGTYTGALNAANNIRLGSNPCAPGAVYTGSLDDFIFYNRVLSNTEVTALYNHLNAFVLPVSWISFSGVLKENQVKLSWQVEAAEKNDHFEVEHSTDGSRFFKKATLRESDGIKTGPGRSLFTYLDAGLEKGNQFYRIKQVDKDGSYSFSKTIQFRVDYKLSGFHLRSNPVTDELVLVNADQTKVLQLQVADMSGRILLNRQAKSTNTIIITSAGKLAPGHYLLKIRSASGVMTIPWIKK